MTKRLQAKKKFSRKLGESLWGQEKDPFLKRSRDQFPTLDQSYEVSEENTKWFMSHFRKTDYEVVDYIKQQSYYIDS